MNDKAIIIVVMAIFLVLAAFPVWYTLAFGGRDLAPPKLEPPDPALFATEEDHHCGEDSDWQKANHMVLLKQWRDGVVRKGESR